MSEEEKKAIEEGMKEVKLIKDGKVKAKTWDRFLEEIKIEDIIFEQHIRNKTIMNTIFITIQTLTLLIGVIAKIQAISCVIIWIFLILVIANNIVTDNTWKKAKRELEEILESEK